MLKDLTDFIFMMTLIFPNCSKSFNSLNKQANLQFTFRESLQKSLMDLGQKVYSQSANPAETDSKKQTSDDDNVIDDLELNPSNNKINIAITFKGSSLKKLYKNRNLDTFLKMNKNLSTSNIHLFNSNGVLTKYDTPLDVLQEYYVYRLDMYEKRKQFVLKELKNTLDINEYKIKFIKEYLNGTILIAKKTILLKTHLLIFPFYIKFFNM